MANKNSAYGHHSTKPIHSTALFTATVYDYHNQEFGENCCFFLTVYSFMYNAGVYCMLSVRVSFGLCCTL